MAEETEYRSQPSVIFCQWKYIYIKYYIYYTNIIYIERDYRERLFCGHMIKHYIKESLKNFLP